MTEAVFQFKAIARKLNRQEQKAEFEEKNPPIPDTSMYGRPYGVAVPLMDQMGSTEAGRLTGILTGGASTPMLGTAELPPYTPSHGVVEPEFIRVDRWVIDEIERITGISNIKI
jgi:hypothetical protein